MDEPTPAAKAVVGWGPATALSYGIFTFIAAQLFGSALLGGIAAAFNVPMNRLWGDNASSWMTLLLASLIGSIIVGLVYLMVKKRGAWEGLGLTWPGAKKLINIGLALLIYLVGLVVVMSLVEVLLPGINLDQDQNIGFKTMHSWPEQLAAALALMVVAPVSEEILFRGFIFRGLNTKLAWPVAALISSGLFGLAHWQLNVSLDTFVLGMAACWLAVRTNSIVPGILLHSIKNTVAFVAVFILGQ